MPTASDSFSLVETPACFLRCLLAHYSGSRKRVCSFRFARRKNSGALFQNSVNILDTVNCTLTNGSGDKYYMRCFFFFYCKFKTFKNHCHELLQLWGRLCISCAGGTTMSASSPQKLRRIKHHDLSIQNEQPPSASPGDLTFLIT